MCVFDDYTIMLLHVSELYNGTLPSFVTVFISCFIRERLMNDVGYYQMSKFSQLFWLVLMCRGNH